MDGNSDEKRSGASIPRMTICFYLILNLDRVLAFKEEGLVLSKKEGGEWAARHIPSEYAAVIQEALLEYQGGGNVLYDLCLAKKYAGYMLEQIQSK